MWFDTVSSILPFKTQLKTCSESAVMLPGNDVFKPLTRFLSHRFKDMRCRIFHQNRTPAVMTEIDAGASLLCLKNNRMKCKAWYTEHCFWSCPRVSEIGMGITNEVSTILKNSIYKDQFVFRPAPKNRYMQKASYCKLTQGHKDVFKVLLFLSGYGSFTFTNYFYY